MTIYMYDTRVISSIKLINLTKTYTQSMARFAASPPQCFAAHVYCTPGACRCNECNNLSAFEATRVEAIESALARNLNAFTNKVTKAEKRASMTTSTGCNCRKSLCLKNYCECFFTGMLCTSECKCVNCENYSGSVALMNKQMQKDKEVADLVNTPEVKRLRRQTPAQIEDAAVALAEQEARAKSDYSRTTALVDLKIHNANTHPLHQTLYGVMTTFHSKELLEINKELHRQQGGWEERGFDLLKKVIQIQIIEEIEVGKNWEERKPPKENGVKKDVKDQEEEVANIQALLKGHYLEVFEEAVKGYDSRNFLDGGKELFEREVLQNGLRFKSQELKRITYQPLGSRGYFSAQRHFLLARWSRACLLLEVATHCLISQSLDVSPDATYLRNIVGQSEMFTAEHLQAYTEKLVSEGESLLRNLRKNAVNAEPFVFGGKSFNTQKQLENGEVYVQLKKGSLLLRTKCVAWANKTGDIAFGLTKHLIEGCVVLVTDVKEKGDVYDSVFVLREGEAVKANIKLSHDTKRYQVHLNTVDELGHVIGGSQTTCSVGRLVLFAVNPSRIPLCTVEHLHEIWKNGISSVVDMWKSINSGILVKMRKRVRREVGR